MVIEFSAESSKTTFVNVPPSLREQRDDSRPVRSDQFRGDTRAGRKRRGERDRDIGDLERAVVARDRYGRVEHAGAGRARRGRNDLAVLCLMGSTADR